MVPCIGGESVSFSRPKFRRMPPSILSVCVNSLLHTIEEMVKCVLDFAISHVVTTENDNQWLACLLFLWYQLLEQNTTNHLDWKSCLKS